MRKTDLRASNLRLSVLLVHMHTVSSLMSSKFTQSGCQKSDRQAKKRLFKRTTDTEGNTSIELDKVPVSSEDRNAFVQFIEIGTRPNQLFLTESIDRNLPYFEDVYNWFDQTLRLIFPNRRYGFLETAYSDESEFQREFQELIADFDLGIDSVALEEVSMPMSSTMKQDLLEEHREKEGDVIVQFPTRNTFITISSDNQIRTNKFTAIHEVKRENREVRFELNEESDGTQRLFELVPAFLDLLNEDHERVYVIDELDRSLHPKLSGSVLQMFLKRSVGQPSQLIVTTHESALLDLKLLRRDEIWFVEKDPEGASSGFSLEEFAPRFDKDVRRGYLQGRFGAIPLVPNWSNE